MERGEIYVVVFDPVVGSETDKTRPAVVVVQNELANRSSPTVTVVPLTSQIARVFPFQARLAAGEGGLEQESKALCEQIRTVSKPFPDLEPRRSNRLAVVDRLEGR